MSYIFSDKELKELAKSLKKSNKINIKFEDLDYNEIISMIKNSEIMKYLPNPNYDNLKLLPEKKNDQYQLITNDTTMEIPAAFSPVIEFSTIYGPFFTEQNIYKYKKLLVTLEIIIKKILEFSNKVKSLSKEICNKVNEADEFYDELRKMTKELESEYDNDIMEMLMLLPDCFVYLCRLLTLEEVSDEYKLKLKLAIIYYMTPIDVIPEGLIGPIGYIDDALLAFKVIKEGFSEETLSREMMEMKWPGRIETLDKIDYYYGLLKKVVGEDLENQIYNFIKIINKENKTPKTKTVKNKK